MNYKGMPNVSYHIAKYLATSFFPKVISEHTHTQSTDRSTWTTAWSVESAW